MTLHIGTKLIHAHPMNLAAYNGCSQADYLKHVYTPGAPNA